MLYVKPRGIGRHAIFTERGFAEDGLWQGTARVTILAGMPVPVSMPFPRSLGSTLTLAHGTPLSPALMRRNSDVARTRSRARLASGQVARLSTMAAYPSQRS